MDPNGTTQQQSHSQTTEEPPHYPQIQVHLSFFMEPVVDEEGEGLNIISTYAECIRLDAPLAEGGEPVASPVHPRVATTLLHDFLKLAHENAIDQIEQAGAYIAGLQAKNQEPKVARLGDVDPAVAERIKRSATRGVLAP